MTLAPGDRAPNVSAPNHRGETVTLTFDDPTVLYFYPRDGSPGCTREAEQFDAEYDTYVEAGVEVYGVSTDDVASHRSFASEYDLSFALLADPDGTLSDAFGVERQSGGEVERTTFVLADGEVKTVYADVAPDGHARDVLVDALDADLVSLEWL